jgi:hypothetical protein
LKWLTLTVNASTRCWPALPPNLNKRRQTVYKRGRLLLTTVMHGCTLNRLKILRRCVLLASKQGAYV